MAEEGWRSPRVALTLNDVRPQCAPDSLKRAASANRRAETLANRTIPLLRVTPSLLAIQHRQQTMLICTDFKPSGGLEPPTPSLP